MRNNAISVANAFVTTANNANAVLTPLKLMKLVYIAYGFGLALIEGESMLDKRFDRVEAWRLGPVIPSVYYSFKHYKNQQITEPAVIMRPEAGAEVKFETPILRGEEEWAIVDIVWTRYGDMPTSELVEILHQKGSPWALSYEEGCNNEIPEEMTKFYYSSLVDVLLRKGNEER